MGHPGRKPNAIPTIEWKLHIPVDLAGQIELLLSDPVKQKVRYGKRGELVIQLLRHWLNEQITVRRKEST